ncbi:coiled-coil domain-containing protein 42-like [Cheilinus undulatus]|uniref:coiled-coil domain-containing protein 42-like n=1 Tax=Cheilinus undulatus TaxID=241271 RepID=UPI001BD20ABA|nr:coiled-coil domain-containing protein 42-like [Cheilinus undulatus]
MEKKSVREKETEAERSPAGPSTMASEWEDSDRAHDVIAIAETRLKHGELDAMIEEREKKLESSKELVKEKQEELKRQKEFHISLEMLHKVRDAEQAAETTERERKEELQMQEEEKRLKEEYATLVKRKKEMLEEIERNSVYKKFMDRVLKMSQFEDVSELANKLDSLLKFNKQLSQKDAEIDQQIEEKRKEISTLTDQQHLERLQGNNELAQLQAELARVMAENAAWSKKWNSIQETAQKKTLLLGEIKMAVANLFELTGGQRNSDEPVDINDTEKLLDQVLMFFNEQNDLCRRCQEASQEPNDANGQKQSKKGQSSQLKGKKVNVKGGKELKKRMTFKN